MESFAARLKREILGGEFLAEPEGTGVVQNEEVGAGLALQILEGEYGERCGLAHIHAEKAGGGGVKPMPFTRHGLHEDETVFEHVGGVKVGD